MVSTLERVGVNIPSADIPTEHLGYKAVSEERDQKGSLCFEKTGSNQTTCKGDLKKVYYSRN